jgi:hypothetical protein
MHTNISDAKHYSASTALFTTRISWLCLWVLVLVLSFYVLNIPTLNTASLYLENKVLGWINFLTWVCEKQEE